MKIIISGKNMTLTDDTKEWAQKKFGKLEKYFKREAKADLLFSSSKHGSLIKLETTIIHRGMVYRAEAENSDSLTVIDKVVDTIDRQIRRHKSKLRTKLHSGAFENFVEEDEFETEEEFNVVKTKKFSIKPMSVEEAILQMELIGHEFFMFRNAYDDEINVVYKRKKGNYGLIEPEA